MSDPRIVIETLAFGGNGVGRIDGKVCFVPYSCPGDELSVRITADKRSYLTASIIEILSPSDQRVAPVCPLFGSCGGCDWQHVAYGCQTASKRRILADALWRGARVPGERVQETVVSPLRYGYRSRVQLKLYGRSAPLRIGFFRQGSHFVEDATGGCPIALPVINEVLQRLRHVVATFPEQDMIPQINIDSAEQGAVAIINYIGRDSDRAAAFFQKHFHQLAPLTGLFLQTGRKASLKKICGEGLLVYTLPKSESTAGRCALRFRPGGFSQVNAAQNEAILKLVREFADCSGSERILDLYCGNGNLSLPLANDVAGVTGIEEYPDSIAAAVDNSRHNGIHNAEFLCIDAAAGMRRLVEEHGTFDIVILDPPRAGAVGAITEILRIKPEKIIYVSCDPSTLARDCGQLSANGYEVRISVPIDMFPQTYHLESVTLLQLHD